MNIIKSFSTVYNLLIILLSINKIQKISCIETNILDLSLYKNEICSYNGDPEIINSIVVCKCYNSFVDEPRQKLIKYVNNQKVQCSYQKKKRFTTVFLAAIIPIGLDYFYLGHYGYFAFIFISFLLICLSQLICFLLEYRLKELEQESKCRFNNKKNNRIFGFIQNDIKKSNNEKIRKCVKIYKIINKILCAFTILYWIIDIVTQSQGKIKDINGVETENDMNTLF